MRVSREKLAKATMDLQAEVQARIMEGAWARVKRYFSDIELRKRLVVALAADAARKQG